MMVSPMVSQGAGPPDGKLAPSGRVGGARKVLRVAMDLLTVAKGQTWQIALTIMLVFLASTAAYNEEYSTASYQTVPGTSPDDLDSLPFQNSTERLPQAGQDLQSPSTESWLDSRSVGANLFTRNVSASSVGTAGQSHIASTQWNLNKISGNLELKRGGQGLLSGDSFDLQSSTSLSLATSPSAGALATSTTGVSPKLSSKELQQLEINTLPSSLLPQVVEAEIIEQAHTVDALPMNFLTSPSSVTSSSLHLDWNMTHQAGYAQEISLNTVPTATDQPLSATILTLETSSPSEHITGINQGLRGTQLSPAKTVHGVDADQLHGDHSTTVPSAETLGYWDRLKEPPYLQSSGSFEAVATSSADWTSLMRTLAPGTTDKRTKHFPLSHGATGHSYLVSMLHTYASILSIPLPTQSFDASSTSSKQISGFNVQGRDITEQATREPLSQSSVRHSSSQFEAPPRVTLVKSPGFTDSSKTQESSTRLLLEPLSVAKSSWHMPVTIESPNISNASAVNGPHTSAESYTEASLRSVFHSGENLTTVPPSHGLSSVAAPTSSSSQPIVAESTLQDSQWSDTTSGLPSRNASLPEMFHSRNSSMDMANVSLDHLAVGAATYVPRSITAGMPGFSPSPATTVLGFDTKAVGTHPGANLSVVHQSSVSTEQTVNSDLTSLSMLPSYLGSAKEQEDSPATEIIPSAFTVERSKLELKEGSPLVAGEYTSPSETSSQVAVSSDTNGTSFLSMQTSGHPPQYSRGETEYLHSWAPSAVLETSPPEDMTITAHRREWIKTELHEIKEQTQAAAKMMPTVFSELPLTASEGTPIAEVKLADHSEKPEVQPTHKHDVLPRQGSEATQLPPRDSTYLAVSMQPSELKVSSIAKKSSDTTVHTSTAGSPLPSYLYLAAAEIKIPVGIAPGRTEYAGLFTGSSTDGVPIELFSMKVAIPTPSPATPSSANTTETGRSSIAHRSVSPGFMSSASTRGHVSESTLIYTEATKGLMARREWMTAASTMLSRTSNTEVQRPDLRASTATSTTYKTAPFLSTGTLKRVTGTSAVTTEVVLGYKATDAFTEVIGTTTALPELPTAQAVTVSTIVGSGTLSSASKSMSSTIPAPFTPLQSTSASLSTSEPLLARKILITTLGSMDINNTSAVTSSKVPSPKETNTTMLITSTKMGTEDVHTSEPLVPKFESETLSQSTERDYLTLSSPTPHIIAVHILPLQFRLTGIDYTESLGNKSSDGYKKLEKEVKLTLNKMLLSYENFLHSNILHFLNGSVIVESEAVFQGEGLIPTPSDAIRTIVTEIERRKMDTFFDWRVDLKSLQSNGFSLENLEPEVLTVSFTFLGLESTAAFGGMTDRESLERLRSEVILLLGTQYQVQDFVLDQVGNSQGDLDITGEAYINTSIHVDISWVLEALRGLVNYSVDLSSLTINGSKLGVQVFPFSFLVTNREVNKELLDRSSLEHKTLARDLSDVLMHILRQYKNFLQVRIREITGGSLMCHGDVIFQHPAPTSKDVLKTLALAIGPKDYLAASSLQVDPFSFTVAGDGLELPLTNLGVPGYGVALIVMCALAIIAVPILTLLPKILGRKGKIIITRACDPEAGVETFELDNPGFHSTVERNPINLPTSNAYTSNSAILSNLHHRCNQQCSENGRPQNRKGIQIPFESAFGGDLNPFYILGPPILAAPLVTPVMRKMGMTMDTTNAHKSSRLENEDGMS